MNESGRPSRVAFLGCGKIARAHAERFAATGHAELAVLCDTVREAAERLAAEHAPRAAIETDWERALETPDLDAVLVASPTALHHAQCRRALERGLHVLCEKPLATSRDEIIDLMNLSHELGLTLCVSFQRRYAASFATARRELTERREKYGPVREVHVFNCENWKQSIAGTWRDDPRSAAGYFADGGIHRIDLVAFVADLRAHRVWATSDRRGTNVEIVTRVVAEMEGGAGMMAHFVGDAGHFRDDIHFHCERADLLVRSEELFHAANGRVTPIADPLPHDTPNAAFLRAIASGRDTLSPAEVALHTHDWTAAVVRAIASGNWEDVGGAGE